MKLIVGIIMYVAILPATVHFGLVYIDTILASKAFLGAAYFGVPKLPAPYDTFEWTLVIGVFIVASIYCLIREDRSEA